MIIHLDSTYRNIQLYPHPSEFELEINGTPQPFDPVRTVSLSPFYAQFVFQWIGPKNTADTSVLPPEWNLIPNDAFGIDFVPVSANSFILIQTPLLETINNDYFIGVVFYDMTSKLTSTVVSYDSISKTIVLNTPIFSEYFKSFMAHDEIRSEISSQGFLINVSYWYKNNLLILGSTNDVPTGPKQLLLAKGINTDLFVINATKNWKRKILSIGSFRNVVLEDIPSYDSGDFFIVWSNPVFFRLFSSDPLFIDGVLHFEFLQMVRKPSVLYGINGLQIRIYENGKQEIVNPGHDFKIGEVIELTDQIQIRVLQIGNGIILNCPYNYTNQYVVVIGDTVNNTVYYFAIVKIYELVLFLDITSDRCAQINRLPHKVIAYLMPFQEYFPNLVAPIVSYNNPVCYDVSILNISMPNLPVCGYNVLLADFPYVIVTITNLKTASGEIWNTLISNNPATFTATFICPIANILNPQIVKFVVVSSNQVVRFKFTNRDNLYFRITLPNGELLQFTRKDIQLYDTPNFPDRVISPNFTPCISINAPLTDSNLIKTVYPLDIPSFISATFQFDMI